MYLSATSGHAFRIMNGEWIQAYVVVDAHKVSM